MSVPVNKTQDIIPFVVIIVSVLPINYVVIVVVMLTVVLVAVVLLLLLFWMFFIEGHCVNLNQPGSFQQI